MLSNFLQSNFCNRFSFPASTTGAGIAVLYLLPKGGRSHDRTQIQ
jgi:hypothetical protein